MRIVEAVLAVNENRKRAMARKVAAVFGGTLSGQNRQRPRPDLQTQYRRYARIAFDPPDHRTSRSWSQIRAYDPEGMEQSKTELSDICYCDGPYSCADGADALVIVTEWEQFRALDLDRLKRAMACPVIIDLRNIYQPRRRDCTRISLRKRRANPASWRHLEDGANLGAMAIFKPIGRERRCHESPAILSRPLRPMPTKLFLFDPHSDHKFVDRATVLRAAVSHRGCFPRPDQVSEGSFGFRYLANTLGYLRRSRGASWSDCSPPPIGAFLSRDEAAPSLSSSRFSDVSLMERIALTSSCSCHISSMDMASRLNFLLIGRLSAGFDSRVPHIAQRSEYSSGGKRSVSERGKGPAYLVGIPIRAYRHRRIRRGVRSWRVSSRG